MAFGNRGDHSLQSRNAAGRHGGIAQKVSLARRDNRLRGVQPASQKAGAARLIIGATDLPRH